MATWLITTLPLTTTEITCDSWDVNDGLFSFFDDERLIAYFWRPISVIRKEDAE